MSDKLKDKLAQVESAIDQARADLVPLKAEKERAKEAFADADGADITSKEWKDAEAAVAAVGAKEDEIAALQTAQIGMLRMTGSENEAMAAGNQARRAEALKAAGNSAPGGAWDARALLNNPETKAALARASTTKSRFGSVEIGEIVDRDTFAADVTGTAEMRLGAYRGIIPQIFRPLRVLDLVPIGTMDGNAFFYTQEGGTFLAAETPEGATKPEDGITFTDAEAFAQTIAAWQKVRKQSLADTAALQSIIADRLRYSVLRRLEAQFLNGNGENGNLTGVLNTTGIGSVPYNAAVPAVELVLAGITNVFLSDCEASGIIMNPLDWQNALTQKAQFIASGSGNNEVLGGSGEYYGGGPFSNTPSIMWGVPVLPSPAIPPGTALVGDFGIGAQILIREGVSVLFSDSDGIDFIQNRVTLLAEMRAANPIWRPVAFQEVALAAPGVTVPSTPQSAGQAS